MIVDSGPKGCAYYLEDRGAAEWHQWVVWHEGVLHNWAIAAFPFEVDARAYLEWKRTSDSKEKAMIGSANEMRTRNGLAELDGSEVGPTVRSLAGDMARTRRAWQEFMGLCIQALRIDRLADWLANRITKAKP